jgi:alpha-amylase/alpha-mannosidase (GH57 family)
MSAAPRSVVIHAHFYQPPREDPWLEEVPREENAAPFHDWNERIERECYRAVTAARIPGRAGRIARIVNAAAHISFDLGPTLASWLERAAPATHARFLDADRESRARLDGHGNAIAAPFHHVILPLCERRDKRTEILWGLADFRRRFGREAEGCWLPETAVDEETLEVLAACGVRFTVLAPHQVAAVPPHGLPGRHRTADGRTIALFLYDGARSHDVAFGALTRDAEHWAAVLLEGRDTHLVSVATDGETYGHHHRFGEMALAAVLDRLAGLARVENYASFLARHRPTHDVRLKPRTSWSCAHGVERWRADCGCRVDAVRWPSQAWRAPLRDGLEALRRGLHALFEREGSGLFGDPWAARDAYGDVLAGAVSLGDLLDRWAPRADIAGRRRAAELLEMERHALGMMTSCGWFFDDISGLESVQVLRYAARAIQLAGPAAAPLEAALRERLAAARSNDAAAGTGRDLYDARARPVVPVAARVAAGVAAAAALGGTADALVPEAFAVRAEEDALVVQHRHTGEAARVSVSITRPRPGQLEIDVRQGDGGDPTRVPVEALPERARRAVRDGLVRELVDLWLSDDETALVCRGGSLAAVAERALLRALEGLGSEPGPLAAAQVLDLLDLHHLLDLPVPFDAQTAFATLRQRLPASLAPQIATLADRLGFA